MSARLPHDGGLPAGVPMAATAGAPAGGHVSVNSVNTMPHPNILEDSRSHSGLHSALDELFDNGIQAYVQSREGGGQLGSLGDSPAVELFFCDSGAARTSAVIIRDNGVGVALNDLQHVLSKSKPRAEHDETKYDDRNVKYFANGDLGSYGVGLKDAAASLGTHRNITTKVAGSNKVFEMAWTKKLLLKRKEANQNPFDLTVVDRDVGSTPILARGGHEFKDDQDKHRPRLEEFAFVKQNETLCKALTRLARAESVDKALFQVEVYGLRQSMYEELKKHEQLAAHLSDVYWAYLNPKPTSHDSDSAAGSDDDADMADDGEEEDAAAGAPAESVNGLVTMPVASGSGSGSGAGAADHVPGPLKVNIRLHYVNGVGDMETTQVFCNTGTIGEMFDAAKRRLHVRLKFHLPKRDHSRVEGAGLHAATRQVTGEAVLLFFPHVNGSPTLPGIADEAKHDDGSKREEGSQQRVCDLWRVFRNGRLIPRAVLNTSAFPFNDTTTTKETQGLCVALLFLDGALEVTPDKLRILNPEGELNPQNVECKHGIRSRFRQASYNDTVAKWRAEMDTTVTLSKKLTRAGRAATDRALRVLKKHASASAKKSRALGHHKTGAVRYYSQMKVKRGGDTQTFKPDSVVVVQEKVSFGGNAGRGKKTKMYNLNARIICACEAANQPAVLLAQLLPEEYFPTSIVVVHPHQILTEDASPLPTMALKHEVRLDDTVVELEQQAGGHTVPDAVDADKKLQLVVRPWYVEDEVERAARKAPRVRERVKAPDLGAVYTLTHTDDGEAGDEAPLVTVHELTKDKYFELQHGGMYKPLRPGRWTLVVRVGVWQEHAVSQNEARFDKMCVEQRNDFGAADKNTYDRFPGFLHVLQTSRLSFSVGPGAVAEYKPAKPWVVVEEGVETDLCLIAKNKHGHVIPLPERLRVTTATATPARDGAPVVATEARVRAADADAPCALVVTTRMSLVMVPASTSGEAETPRPAVTPGAYVVRVTVSEGASDADESKTIEVPVYVWRRPRGTIGSLEGTSYFAKFQNGQRLLGPTPVTMAASTPAPTPQPSPGVVLWAPPAGCYLVWRPQQAAAGDGQPPVLCFDVADDHAPPPEFRIPMCDKTGKPRGMWGCSEGVTFQMPPQQVRRGLAATETEHNGELQVVLPNPIPRDGDGDGKVGEWGSQSSWWQLSIGQRKVLVEPSPDTVPARIELCITQTRQKVEGGVVKLPADSAVFDQLYFMLKSESGKTVQLSEDVVHRAMEWDFSGPDLEDVSKARVPEKCGDARQLTARLNPQKLEAALRRTESWAGRTTVFGDPLETIVDVKAVAGLPAKCRVIRRAKGPLKVPVGSTTWSKGLKIQVLDKAGNIATVAADVTPELVLVPCATRSAAPSNTGVNTGADAGARGDGAGAGAAHVAPSEASVSESGAHDVDMTAATADDTELRKHRVKLERNGDYWVVPDDATIVCKLRAACDEYTVCALCGEQRFMKAMQAIGESRHDVTAHVVPGAAASLCFVNPPATVRKYDGIALLRVGLLDAGGNRLPLGKIKKLPTLQLEGRAGVLKTGKCTRLEEEWQFKDVYITEAEVDTDANINATWRGSRSPITQRAVVRVTAPRKSHYDIHKFEVDGERESLRLVMTVRELIADKLQGVVRDMNVIKKLMETKQLEVHARNSNVDPAQSAVAWDVLQCDIEEASCVLKPRRLAPAKSAGTESRGKVSPVFTTAGKLQLTAKVATRMNEHETVTPRGCCATRTIVPDAPASLVWVNGVESVDMGSSKLSLTGKLVLEDKFSNVCTNASNWNGRVEVVPASARTSTAATADGDVTPSCTFHFNGGQRRLSQVLDITACMRNAGLYRLRFSASKRGSSTSLTATLGLSTDPDIQLVQQKVREHQKAAKEPVKAAREARDTAQTAAVQALVVATCEEMNGDKLVPPTELATWIKGRLADVNTELGHLDTQTWDWERDRVTTIPIPAGAGAVAGGVTAIVGVDDLQLSRALSWHLAYALPQLVCEGERPDGTPTPGCLYDDDRVVVAELVEDEWWDVEDGVSYVNTPTSVAILALDYDFKHWHPASRFLRDHLMEQESKQLRKCLQAIFHPNAVVAPTLEAAWGLRALMVKKAAEDHNVLAPIYVAPRSQGQPHVLTATGLLLPTPTTAQPLLGPWYHWCDNGAKSSPRYQELEACKKLWESNATLKAYSDTFDAHESAEKEFQAAASNLSDLQDIAATVSTIVSAAAPLAVSHRQLSKREQGAVRAALKAIKELDELNHPVLTQLKAPLGRLRKAFEALPVEDSDSSSGRSPAAKRRRSTAASETGGGGSAAGATARARGRAAHASASSAAGATPSKPKRRRTRG